jgi:hypothetical protein
VSRPTLYSVIAVLGSTEITECIMNLIASRVKLGVLVIFSAMARQDARAVVHTERPLPDDARTTLRSLEGSLVNLTLCQSKCRGGCHSYITPLGICFPSGDWFPNDPSWSDGWDILDTLIVGTSTLHRAIYPSKNGSCAGRHPDTFDIPLGVCVGPFGVPRPWGTFAILPINDIHTFSYV